MVPFCIRKIERISAGSQFSDSASQMPECVFQFTRVAGSRPKTNPESTDGQGWTA